MIRQTGAQDPSRWSFVVAPPTGGRPALCWLSALCSAATAGAFFLGSLDLGRLSSAIRVYTGCSFALAALLLVALAGRQLCTMAVVELHGPKLRVSRWLRPDWTIEWLAIRRLMLRPTGRGAYALVLRLDDGTELPLPIELDAVVGFELGGRLWSALTEAREVRLGQERL
jgi:hypothetical protein